MVQGLFRRMYRWFHYVNHCPLVVKSSRTQPPRSPDLTAMDADGRTDGNTTKLIGAFRDFANVPKKYGRRVNIVVTAPTTHRDHTNLYEFFVKIIHLIVRTVCSS